MSNFQNFMEGLPLEQPKLPLCAMTLEMVKAQPDPLFLLTQFPYERQWLDNSAWRWLSFEVLHQQGKQYTETGDIKSFTRQTAFNIAQA